MIKNDILMVRSVKIWRNGDWPGGVAITWQGNCDETVLTTFRSYETTTLWLVDTRRLTFPSGGIVFCVFIQWKMWHCNLLTVVLQKRLSKLRVLLIKWVIIGIIIGNIFKASAYPTEKSARQCRVRIYY